MGGVCGWFEVNGVREEVNPSTFRANRDRSWGVRQPLVPNTSMKAYQRASAPGAAGGRPGARLDGVPNARARR
jgi:hypothetical protein